MTETCWSENQRVQEYKLAVKVLTYQNKNNFPLFYDISNPKLYTPIEEKPTTDIMLIRYILHFLRMCALNDISFGTVFHKSKLFTHNNYLVCSIWSYPYSSPADLSKEFECLFQTFQPYLSLAAQMYLLINKPNDINIINEFLPWI